MTETNTQTRRVGYARVSTYGQTLDAQLEQLRAEGCAKIYREKVSGARADRRELLKLLKTLKPGDLGLIRKYPNRVGECQKPGALYRELDCWVAKPPVQHRGPDLKHTMGAAGRPAHLPSLVHAGTYQLVDRAFRA